MISFCSSPTIPATIEAFHNTQKASGIAIEGLFEGLMQRAFSGKIPA